MKKNLLKLGALALAVALAFAFAACQQPTEETTGSGDDVIIRLWLNSSQGTIAATDEVLLVLGNLVEEQSKTDKKEKDQVPYPDAGVKDGDGNFVEKIQPIITSVTPLTVGTTDAPGTLFTSLANDYASNMGTLSTGFGATLEPGQIARSEKGTYIDFILYKVARNKTDPSKFTTDPVTLSEGGSYYVYLMFLNGSGSNPIADGTYVYTTDTTGRNKPADEIKAEPKYNGNVEKVELKLGVNDLYLANFSK